MLILPLWYLSPMLNISKPIELLRVTTSKTTSEIFKTHDCNVTQVCPQLGGGGFHGEQRVRHQFREDSAKPQFPRSCCKKGEFRGCNWLQDCPILTELNRENGPWESRRHLDDDCAATNSTATATARLWSSQQEPASTAPFTRSWAPSHLSTLEPNEVWNNKVPGRISSVQTCVFFLF